MRFLAGNAQHIGGRHSQQDSFGFADPEDQEFVAHGGFLAIVCDGMGGMEYGDAASRTAVRAFLDAYRRKTPAESIPDALLRSVHEANDHVLSLAASLGLIEGIGTTLVAATLHNGGMYYVSVGDSGLFYVGQGTIRMVNRPHIFANVLDAAVARGNLSAEDAAIHPERESLTSYIGAQRLEEIDANVEPFPLEEGEAMLLASDGLFKTLEISEIAACCTGPSSGWPEKLVETTIARNREYQDNVTVLSVAFAGPGTFAVPPTAPPRIAHAEEQAVPRTVKMSPPPAAEAAHSSSAVPPVPAPAPQAWTPPVPAEASTAAPKRPNLWIPLLIIILLAAAGGAGWYYMQHRPGFRPSVPAGSGAQPPHRDPMPPRVIDPKDVEPPSKEPPVQVPPPGQPAPEPGKEPIKEQPGKEQK